MTTQYTAKGYPWPQGSDLVAGGDDVIKTMADLLDLRPGVSAYTTAARDALAASEKWVGRIIFNTTRGTFEMYNGTSWVQRLGGYQEIVQTMAGASGAVTLNLAVANYFVVEKVGALTISFSNPAPVGFASSAIVELVHSASGAVSWAASIKWPQNVIPVLSTTVGLVDMLVFSTRDGGDVYRGALSAKGWA